MGYDIGPVIGIEGEKEFRDSIRQINTNMRTLGTEMQVVASKYEKNDKSTEALTEKNEVLNKQITVQKKKIEELTKGLKASSDKYGENHKVTQGWKQSLNKATSGLNNLERELKSNVKSIDEFGDEVQEASKKTSKFSGIVGGLKKGIKGVGGTIGKAAMVGVKSVGVAAVGAAAGMVALTESTREYRSDISKLEQNAKTAGNSMGVIKDELGGLVAITGETDSSIEALSNLMATGFNDSQITEAVNALSGAVIKFPDTLKIESLADGLQETLATGKAVGPFAELIERTGGNLDEFNKGLANTTSEAEKQQYALNWLAESGLGKITDEYGEANKAMLEAAQAQFRLDDALAGLADIAEPAISILKGGLANVLSNLVGIVTGAEGATDKFKDSIKTFATDILNQMNDLIPIISSTMEALIPALVEGITEALPTLGKAATDILLVLVTELVAALPDLIPVAIDIIMTLVNGIVDALPVLIPAITDIIITIVSNLIDLIPELIPAAIAIIIALAEGLIDALPELIDMVPQLIIAIADVLIENLPLIIDTGIRIIIALNNGILNSLAKIIASAGEIIGSLLGGLLGGIGRVLSFVPELFSELVNKFSNINWGQLGKDIIDGIKSGVTGAASALAGSVVGVAKGALKGVKSFLGIRSPSKVMKEQVGAMIGAGLAEGIVDSAKEVDSAMSRISQGMNIDAGVNIGSSSSGKNIVKHLHSGTLKIEGVNNQGEFVNAVEMILDEFRREVRMA